MEFEAFPKIQRYEKGMAVITEKIDGTNACIVFDVDGNLTCQSRNRIIVPGDDNAGFAQWAHANEAALFDFFGPGRYFGEWFGCGIQRGYGMRERVFAPFNTGRFTMDDYDCGGWPDGVSYTPVMNVVQLTELNAAVNQSMEMLAANGSFTRQGWGWTPEGCMVWSPQFGYLKVPFEGAHKWELEAQVAA